MDIRTQIMQVVTEKGGTDILLEHLCKNLSNNTAQAHELILLKSQLVEIDGYKSLGTVPIDNYLVHKNRIKKALLELVDDLEETMLEKVKRAIDTGAGSPYRILTLSKDETDREKMEALLGQYPEFNSRSKLSSDLPDDISTYHIIIFDNFSFGEIIDKDHYSDAEYGHIDLMEEWLDAKRAANDNDNEQEPADGKEEKRGLIVHYGKRCYLLEQRELSKHCAAANFPFTLYGLIKQILAFLDRG